MTDKEILKHVVEYCSERNADVGTLNKISETVSLTAQKHKGKLSSSQKDILNKAMGEWVEGNPTPAEFKGVFRGGN
jgi:hypothetical protein